ncbi:MAG TPA: hypothetical protein VMV94_00830 [Phycisphaerae bacterium]|nr:hypothetical protein [Phycisphaerae bacterium]
MNLNSDFSELLKIFNAAGVRFLIAGAHAVAYHAEPRFTAGVDLWVDPSPENASRVWAALRRYGAPLGGIAVTDFANPDTIYQIGVEPNRIDIVMGIDGVSFAAAWRHRVRAVYGNIPVCILGRAELIRNKRATGRPQDLLDLQRLTRGKRNPRRGARRRSRRK